MRATTAPETRASMLKWVVLALLILSGLDLKPASAATAPLAADPPAAHR